jgi:hypothetical protein
VDAAGSLFGAGTTAYGAVRAVSPAEGVTTNPAFCYCTTPQIT